MQAVKPKYRWDLRFRIHRAGYRAIQDFSRDLRIDNSKISRILNGWEIPSLPLQKKIAEKLQLTSEGLVKLL